MTHTVQFTNFNDFIGDLSAVEATVYHQLIEQRTATSDYGASRWLLTTILRALVADGRIIHVASLTIPHGPQVTRLNGTNFDPPGINDADRWRQAGEQHDTIVDHLQQHVGIMTRVRPGILNVPADLPLVLAAHPLDELADELVEANKEATAPPG